MNGGPKPAMYHMLKSLGINPEIVESTASDLKETANKIALAFSLMDEKLTRIEHKLDLLLKEQEIKGDDQCLKLLSKPQ